jgi:signal transduction histidine kinase
LEHLILGDMRDHAAITATEEERARLASEIHDGPLQELAAVIGELDDTPHMDGAANLLREVAAELRGVTTALR